MEHAEPKTAAAATQPLTPIIRELLRQRGVNDVEKFLGPDYDRDLADPYLMTGMAAAIERLLQAVTNRERVAVYGDYDIDGIASTAIILEMLTQHGLHPISYIPDRYEEGYGLNIPALEELKKQQIDLVISVDCGITSVEEAQWAADSGLDLIITDHHDVPPVLPTAAIAIVNPKQPDDQYPFKDLAGAGVAFAVVRALQQRTGIPMAGQEKWLLDLVALGTVCDVMPLVGENRTLVKYGLIVLQKTRRTGLVALAQSAGIDLDQIRAYHLGYTFGPRLNAAGRLEHANSSLALVTTGDPVAAQQMAFDLEELNHQRRLEQDRILTEADALAARYTADSVLVLSDPGWSHGVVGIVASKLAEKWNKPTLLLQELGESAKGSGRSARGYSLIEGLRANQELFDRFGGHDFAAGFTMPAERLEELRQGLNEHYASVQDSLPEVPTLEAELLIDDPEQVNWRLMSELQRLEPFGNGNPQPLFGLQAVKVVDASAVGKERQHLKLRLAGPSGIIFEAIGFNLAEKYPNLKPGQVVNVLCYIQQNEFNGRSHLQLVLRQVV